MVSRGIAIFLHAIGGEGRPSVNKAAIMLDLPGGWLYPYSLPKHSTHGGALVTVLIKKYPIALLAAAVMIAGCAKKSPTETPATTAPIAIEMVAIPAGMFTMGSLASDPYPQAAAQPQRAVYLAAYQIGKYEVTNAQFKAFIDSGGYSDYKYWSSDGWNWRTLNGVTKPLYWGNTAYKCGPSFPTHPVVGVTWYEADAFARWAWRRLPTEAEWEKAARGDDARSWPWGSSWDSTKCNSSGGNAPPDTFSITSPVGSFAAGASPYGVFDMAGNVSEFVSDRYDSSYYHSAPDSNPSGPASGTLRAIRGGGYYFSGNNSCCCYWRQGIDPSYRRFDSGFRVAQ
jgi:formylglycine-generating enzyme required for sulfatase activity